MPINHIKLYKNMFTYVQAHMGKEETMEKP